MFSRSAADKAAVRGHLLISHARGFIFIFMELWLGAICSHLGSAGFLDPL